MNPDVTDNITLLMSELQLQFLQHLKIQPLHSNITAPVYQPTQLHSISAGDASKVVQDTAAPSAPAEVLPPEPVLPQWISAETSSPLVQDMLMFLQQAGVQAQWFYQAATTDIHLTAEGLFSGPPQHFLAAASKKQLWQSIVQQLPAEISTDTDPT